MNVAIEKLKSLVESEGSQAAVARKLGVSRAYVNDLLLGRREVSDRIAAKLGFEWRLVSVNPMPHPDDAVNVPPLVERELKERTK